MLLIEKACRFWGKRREEGGREGGREIVKHLQKKRKEKGKKKKPVFFFYALVVNQNQQICEPAQEGGRLTADAAERVVAAAAEAEGAAMQSNPKVCREDFCVRVVCVRVRR